MKRFFVLCVVAAAFISVTSCGNNEEKKNGTDTSINAPMPENNSQAPDTIGGQNLDSFHRDTTPRPFSDSAHH
ncbi:hypothetical protein SAMN05421788_103237 [Filimonas lacunae]|uniref:Uncharacterized protein n=1 Tax=Filimonas lacunae TaxID=477680 RepID=A0A173MJT0_9BACT|nr:hypothetical protein [Filimonas lacunae]BAV07893.1 hypothetical protein FLA_3924 [Filimonas lacunae]SIT06101.1 hypothetical protein SAMN05421788_103237 [Filimonas lacunae]